jgi:DNA-binding NtrC family response regulator
MANSSVRILIVDDEELICWSLAKQLTKEGYDILTAHSGEEGLDIFDSKAPEIILLDHKLPGANGLEVLVEMKERNPSAVIILMTAYGNVKSAVKAMKKGAYEYVNKPIDFDEIKLLISRALEAHKIEGEIAKVRRELKEQYGFNSIIGQSPAMREIFRMIRKIANSEAGTVLIQGESGTGKELVARAIHYESKRLDKPCTPINCAALPETLLASELFGFEKGAFTDAKQMKKGQLELAEGGTIFLDEIGEISTATQVKLLRMLETRIFKRLGGVEDIKINVRIVAATNSDLDAALRNGKFRQDLYYRLKVIHIWIPPLRNRPEDIPLLTKFFINRYNREFGKNFSGVETIAEKALLHYSWPGNVRELRNVIERVLILENDPQILTKHLPPEVTGSPYQTEESSVIELNIPDDGLPLDQVESTMIQKALEKTNGNQSRAANLLSISRDAMRYKMKKYGFLN